MLAGIETATFTGTTVFAATDARPPGDGVTRLVTPGTLLIVTLLKALDALKETDAVVLLPGFKVTLSDVGVQVTVGLPGLAAPASDGHASTVQARKSPTPETLSLGNRSRIALPLRRF